MNSLLSYTSPNYIQKQDQGSPLHIPQPFVNYGGLSKMLSGDYKYTPRESPYQNIPQEKSIQNRNGFANTLFQNESQNNNKEGEKTMEGNQEDETSGFWLKNDMYRSFIKGNNPWAKSSAFTQKIQNTRGAYLFYQNAFDSPIGGQSGLSAAEQRKREEELRKEQEEAERRAKEEAELQERIRSAQIGAVKKDGLA